MSENNSELKMWVAIRTDISMSIGKIAAQAGHGFVDAYLKAMETHSEMATEYHEKSRAKISVKAKSEHVLKRIAEECQENNIPYALILDEGRTEFSEPTYTVCGFGPYRRDDLPKYLKNLQKYDL